jgi:hypothetical protein
VDKIRSSQRLKLAACFVVTAIFLLPSILSAQTPPPRPIMLGTAWYPEQWPESRWDADLTLMQQAGIHMVRVGEFAWSRMEPREGQYDFDWLDRALTAASKHGIYSVIGTPTAAPPAWLTQKYPETLRVDEESHRAEHGNRQQFNFANGKYRELARKIAEQLAKRFGHNPYVLGWQIDNEYSDISFDADTKAQFQQWLKARYGTLENLNSRWTTSYWSETIFAWDQIPIQTQGLSRWRGGRFACTSLIRRWSLERLTVARYDDVNMDRYVSSISMSINNGLLAQLLSIQQLPTQTRFKSHSSTRPPQTPAASS